MSRHIGRIISIGLLGLASSCMDAPTAPRQASPQLGPELSQATADVSIQSTTQHCAPPWYSTVCRTGSVPANHVLNRVWFGVETSWSVADYEIWDLNTNVRVGAGRVARYQHFRSAVYGLYGARYQLRLRGDGTPYAFICDC